MRPNVEAPHSQRGRPPGVGSDPPFAHPAREGTRRAARRPIGLARDARPRPGRRGGSLAAPPRGQGRGGRGGGRMMGDSGKLPAAEVHAALLARSSDPHAAYELLGEVEHYELRRVMGGRALLERWCSDHPWRGEECYLADRRTRIGGGRMAGRTCGVTRTIVGRACRASCGASCWPGYWRAGGLSRPLGDGGGDGRVRSSP